MRDERRGGGREYEHRSHRDHYDRDRRDRGHERGREQDRGDQGDRGDRRDRNDRVDRSDRDRDYRQARQRRSRSRSREFEQRTEKDHGKRVLRMTSEERRAMIAGFDMDANPEIKQHQQDRPHDQAKDARRELEETKD